MNNDLKYVIRGALLALFIIITIITIQSYIPATFFTPNKAVTVNTVKKDSIHIIANIEGQNLFNKNCTACHRLFGRVDGPSIKGAENRVNDRKLLYEWIRNPDKVLQSGNPYFNNLIKEYGVMMRGSPQLTDAQIDAMLDYIKEVEAQDNL